MKLETLKAMAQVYSAQKKKQQPQLPEQVQTMAQAYSDICSGEDPWTALGNFTNAWYGYAIHVRPALVSESLTKPAQGSEYILHWGAFCAASVEFLCERYDVPCPDWVNDPTFILTEPWYGTNENLRNFTTFIPPLTSSMQQHRRETAPAPFVRRNIFCGNRLFQNKYEVYEWICEAIEQGIADIHEIHNYVRQRENSIHGVL